VFIFALVTGPRVFFYPSGKALGEKKPPLAGALRAKKHPFTTLVSGEITILFRVIFLLCANNKVFFLFCMIINHAKDVAARIF
jgi:hypothetical protein